MLRVSYVKQAGTTCGKELKTITAVRVLLKPKLSRD
jgi:hypothetical protein